MKRYILSLNLLALIFLGCEPKERLNINNPVYCMLDSISIHYYLTTKKNVLTTTFRQGETMVVHYDLCNLSKHSWGKVLLLDFCIPYLQGLHGKCYTASGKLVEEMSFYPTSYRGKHDYVIWDVVYNEGHYNDLAVLKYQDYRDYDMSTEISVPTGKYYYETTPRIGVRPPLAMQADTTIYTNTNPLRIYFTVE